MLKIITLFFSMLRKQNKTKYFYFGFMFKKMYTTYFNKNTIFYKNIGFQGKFQYSEDFRFKSQHIYNVFLVSLLSVVYNNDDIFHQTKFYFQVLKIFFIFFSMFLCKKYINIIRNLSVIDIQFIFEHSLFVICNISHSDVNT